MFLWCDALLEFASLPDHNKGTRPVYLAYVIRPIRFMESNDTT